MDPRWLLGSGMTIMLVVLAVLFPAGLIAVAAAMLPMTVLPVLLGDVSGLRAPAGRRETPDLACPTGAAD